MNINMKKENSKTISPKLGLRKSQDMKLTLKKTTIDANKKDTITIFKTAYFNSKAKTLINKGEANESIHTSNQEILNGISVWLSEHKLGLKKSQDIDINMTNKQPKNFFLN